MRRTLVPFCLRLFSVVSLSIVAITGHCADVYARIGDDGKLLVAHQKNDARYVKFNSRAQRVSSSSFSWSANRITPYKTSFIAARKSSRLAPKVVEEKISANIPLHSKALSYTPLINNIASETGVNPNLLHAIIQVESAYNPNATSPKGAQGLMQLIPATAVRFGVGQSYDPEANIRGGARYVKNLLARFDNNLHLTLAAYNAGEGSVQKYNNTIPPYPETQAYVQKVLSLFAQREQ